MNKMNFCTKTLPAAGTVVSMVVVNRMNMPMTTTGTVDENGVVYILTIERDERFDRLPNDYRLVAWFEIPEEFSNAHGIGDPWDIIPF